MLKTILRATLVTVVLSSAALAEDPAKIAQTSKGATLVDAKGMTLYTFAKDASGKSVCNGPCAANWPPLMATDSAGAPAGYSVIARDDGARQWAYKGKPLYTWVKDTKPGDTTGDGVLEGAWRVATP